MTMDLFGNNADLCSKRGYRRDAYGRFADKRTADYERALKEAATYKRMYQQALSRMRGISRLLRMKDEQINKLKKQ